MTKAGYFPMRMAKTTRNDENCNDVKYSGCRNVVDENRAKYVSLSVQGIVTLIIALSISLYAPFYPAMAERKGASTGMYAFVLGSNCLTAFLVTPIVGRNLQVIGPRFAYIMGIFVSGVCCLLTGFLDQVPAGVSFIALSIAIRVVSAVGNAGIITASFSFFAYDFPQSLAFVFSLNRFIMSVGQLLGPALGGALIEVGGFRLPFVSLGFAQICVSFFCIFILPEYDVFDNGVGDSSQKTLTLWNVFKIPTIYMSFGVFIVSTMANGFLSVTLEPYILRHYHLREFYLGLVYGIKDGASSVATPAWGWLCDNPRAVKPCILVCCLIVSVSLFTIEPLPGIHFHESLCLLCIALGLNGVGIAGLQVSGVIDAFQVVIAAGYPDDPITHGCVAGLWSSFSGLGRFVGRSTSGVLIDYVGFRYTTAAINALLCVVMVCTAVFLFVRCFENSKRKTSVLKSYDSEKKSLLGSNVDVKSNKLMASYEFHRSQNFVAAL